MWFAGELAYLVLNPLLLFGSYVFFPWAEGEAGRA